MLSNNEEHSDLIAMLNSWTTDPKSLKKVFVQFKTKFDEMEDVTLSFKSRPGISYSLRAGFSSTNKKKRPLFAVIDIVDDDPEDRWFSVCFYEDSVRDPEKRGELIPLGLLGEDGYCFNIEENDGFFVSYVEQRIDEAYANTS